MSPFIASTKHAWRVRQNGLKYARSFSHFLESSTVVRHTSFDRAALNAACAKYNERLSDLIWLDTACVVRRAWPMFAKKGYGLAKVCEYLGISFQHHDAVEDARAAGEILLNAMSHTGLDVEQWLVRVSRPIDPDRETARVAAIDGPLLGETLGLCRKTFHDEIRGCRLCRKSVCDVGDSVTKRTTILVVGDQDLQRLAGQDKSAKHRKAETLIREGQAIRIIAETDFRPCSL